MPNFEVHIPAADPRGFNMTLKVTAENWMAALKAGMKKLGEQGAISQNVMVDIQDDNSIHITESSNGRVFRIRELSDEEAATAPVKRPSGLFRQPGAAEAKTAPPAPAESSRSSTEKTLPPASAVDPKKTVPAGLVAVSHEAPTPKAAHDPQPTATGRVEAAGAKASAAPSPGLAKQLHKSSPRVEVGTVEELESPVRPVTGQIGRARTNPDVQAAVRAQTEEVLADIFMRITELERVQKPDEALTFLLDLAMEKVPCEAGSVLRSDAATGDLHFVVARGPKAKELLGKKIVLSAGEGIAGFCAAEGVSVAVRDAQKDPRFNAAVGERVDYRTKSILCAPMMTHGRSFGCVQLLNRLGGDAFLEHEAGVLAYLSHQAALYLNSRV